MAFKLVDFASHSQSMHCTTSPGSIALDGDCADDKSQGNIQSDICMFCCIWCNVNIVNVWKSCADRAL